MAECDELTRPVFVKKYGFHESRRYPLIVDGRIYDSKAIVAAAFGKQHGTPLKASEFSGGIATVLPLLERLGFPVTETPNPAVTLVPGQTYKRKDLLARYGGQLLRGIWTPKEFPVVFVFSGKTGEAYGYVDGEKDGVFEYTGEGTVGAMTFDEGNKAIRDHRADGKDILLFIDNGKGKGVTYRGLVECRSYVERNGHDKNRAPRKIIVFDLVPVTTGASLLNIDVPAPDVTNLPAVALDALREAAYEAASITSAQPRVGDANRIWRQRSKQVRDYVLARAKGTCEACGEKAPFVRRDGTPYLEPHHTTRLADEGLDHPRHVGAICPTCHRRIHSGRDGRTWNKQLQDVLLTKEPKQE